MWKVVTKNYLMQVMMITDSDNGVQHDSQQPEWMYLLQPVANFDEPTSDFTHDEGALDLSWTTPLISTRR